MFGKAFITLGGLAVPAAYFMGAFGGGTFDRTVAASPADVRSALLDLDIRKAPGSPGTDMTRAAGVQPLFQLTQEGDDMVWTVMSGKNVAVRMIAHLEPLEGGSKTRVTAEVQRGNAPDDFVSPAFRSEGITLGLFSVVLEDELDDLVRPKTGITKAECQELFEKLMAANAPEGGHQSGFAGVARTAITLSAVEQELKAKGCDTGFKDDFEQPTEHLSEGSGSPPPVVRTEEDVSFKPGKPMVDLSKD
jgi:hypothetical protein